MRTEIIALVWELDIPQSADELLAAFEGREDELVKNLKMMKAKKAEDNTTITQINALIEELGIVTKSPDEMLAAYKGREVVLLKNLKKMRSKMIKDAEVKAEVAFLAGEVNATKSAEEMLAGYKGREEELLKNLRKYKSMKDVSA